MRPTFRMASFHVVVVEDFGSRAAYERLAPFTSVLDGNLVDIDLRIAKSIGYEAAFDQSPHANSGDTNCSFEHMKRVMLRVAIGQHLFKVLQYAASLLG